MNEREFRTAYVVGRLDRSLRRAMEAELTPMGITLTQFTTLTVIARRSGLSNAQLARRALVTPQAMQQVLSALSAKGLIQRTSDPAHHGILLTALTSSGVELVRQGEAAIAAVETQMLRNIPDHRRAAFLEELQSCVSNLGGGLTSSPLTRDHQR